MPDTSGSTENAFSAIIDGVQHFASSMEELAEHAIAGLANIGVSIFNGLTWFIHFLIDLQEDPVHVISRMVAKIQEVGAHVTSVLEEIVHGIQAHGLMGYVKIKVQESLIPFHNTLDEQVRQSNKLTSLHQQTLSSMQTKLDALKSTGPRAGWQGASADQMSATFALHSTTLTNLTNPFNTQNSLTNHYWQETTVANFMGLIVAFAIIDVLLIVTGIVGAIFTAGGTLAVGGYIMAGVIAVEVAILLAYVQVSTTIWQHGTLPLYLPFPSDTATLPDQTGQSTTHYSSQAQSIFDTWKGRAKGLTLANVEALLCMGYNEQEINSLLSQWNKWKGMENLKIVDGKKKKEYGNSLASLLEDAQSPKESVAKGAKRLLTVMVKLWTSQDFLTKVTIPSGTLVGPQNIVGIDVNPGSGDIDLIIHLKANQQDLFIETGGIAKGTESPSRFNDQMTRLRNAAGRGGRPCVVLVAPKPPPLSNQPKDFRKAVDRASNPETGVGANNVFIIYPDNPGFCPS